VHQVYEHASGTDRISPLFRLGGNQLELGGPGPGLSGHIGVHPFSKNENRQPADFISAHNTHMDDLIKIFFFIKFTFALPQKNQHLTAIIEYE
jgi:hypothetical protein